MGKCLEIYKLVYAKIIERYPISTFFFFTFWIAFMQQHYNLQHLQGYFHCPRVLNLQSWSFLLFCFSTQPQKLMLKFDIERLQRMPPLVTSNFLHVHQKTDLHLRPVLSFYCIGTIKLVPCPWLSGWQKFQLFLYRMFMIQLLMSQMK